VVVEVTADFRRISEQVNVAEAALREGGHVAEADFIRNTQECEKEKLQLVCMRERGSHEAFIPRRPRRTHRDREPDCAHAGVQNTHQTIQVQIRRRQQVASGDEHEDDPEHCAILKQLALEEAELISEINDYLREMRYALLGDQEECGGNDDDDDDGDVEGTSSSTTLNATAST